MKREIEKKYLLKDAAAREHFIQALHARFPDMQHQGTKTIISYFYEPAEQLSQILAVGQKLLGSAELQDLSQLVEASDEIMVKCRSVDDQNYFSVKGAHAGQDAVHAASRMEFEQELPLSLEQIHHAITAAGITLVSKWSSKRDFYSLDDGLKAEVEFVSGYGYKVELELLLDADQPIAAALARIDALAEALKLEYASDQLMGRMYAYYNQHWPEYFNTSKTFSNQVWKQLKRAVR